MNFLFEKKETEKEIIIIDKYPFLQILFIFLAILLSFLLSFFEIAYFYQDLVFFSFVCLAFITIILKAKVQKEIQSSMKKSWIEMKGSMYSLKNPLTYRISKKD